MYIMSLFEIVDTTYSVAFTFLASENEENFTWVLQMLLAEELKIQYA